MSQNEFYSKPDLIYLGLHLKVQKRYQCWLIWHYTLVTNVSAQLCIICPFAQYKTV
jgi:hypothetical protein